MTAKRKKYHHGDKHLARRRRVRNRKKDLDEIDGDLKEEKTEKLLNQDVDLDLPGAAQHYCLHYARYFIDDQALKEHFKTKVHKRRLKALELEPYSIEESERAAGHGNFNEAIKRKITTLNTEKPLDEDGDAVLDEMHERAEKEKNPHVYTVATLTGHAVRACGEGYTIVMDNHAARAKGHAEAFRMAGDSIGDMVEVSTIRREDLAAHRGRVPGDQVHQAASQPSTAMPRGHQGPAGFLLLTSGLDGGSVPYSHVDVAASAGSLPAPPTAAPLLALAAHYKLIKS